MTQPLNVRIAASAGDWVHKQDYERARDRITELEGDCKLLEKEVHRLEVCRQEEQERLMELEARIAFLEEAIGAKDRYVTELEAEIARLREANKNTADLVFNHIKHGDEKHRQWLREKLDEIYEVGKKPV